MNRSSVKGYLGELLVMQHLKREGYTVTQRGNQSGFDLIIEELNAKVDVKLSILQVGKIPQHWGWALKHENKKRRISCSHFVCVALDKGLNTINYYIIKAKHLNKFPKSGMGRFKGVSNGLVVLPPKESIPIDGKVEMRNYFLACAKLVKNGIAKKLNPNWKLGKYLQP